MHCPHCDTPNLRTTETFKTPDKVYRTKQCRSCGWKFTSHETLADELTIPQAIRNVKHKRPTACRPTPN